MRLKEIRRKGSAEPVIRVMILAVTDIAVVDDARDVQTIFRSGNDPRFLLKWCASDARHCRRAD